MSLALHPNRRRVILHVGMNKTGSTALQVALVRNRELLASHGVDYPRHDSDSDALSGGAQSGNGTGLLPLLALARSRRGDPEKALADTLAVVAASVHPTVLYSCELLYALGPRRLERLRSALDRLDTDLQIVVVVRDVAGHAYSEYAQAVKRERCTMDFVDYVAADGPYSPAFRTRLTRFDEVVGAGNVMALHYDGIRHRLASEFLESVLGIPLSEGGLSEPAGLVNRSLTREELDLARRANAGIEGWRAGYLLSDLMIARPPLGQPGAQIPGSALQVLTERFAEDVAWVNARFFATGTGGPLRVDSAGVDVVAEAGLAGEITPRERELLDCLTEVINSVAPATPPAPGAGFSRTDAERVGARFFPAGGWESVAATPPVSGGASEREQYLLAYVAGALREGTARAAARPAAPDSEPGPAPDRLPRRRVWRRLQSHSALDRILARVRGR